MTKTEFDHAVMLAGCRVRAMDDVDGFHDRDLRTILFALEAGLRDPDNGSQFDAYYMLKDKVDGPLATRAGQG